MTIIDGFQFQAGHTAGDSGLSTEEELALSGVDPATRAGHRLDSDEKTQARFRRALGWWEFERSSQSSSRTQRLKDHDYFDGDQWDKEDREIVENRGQKAAVWNLTKPIINWVTGTERRTRVDWRVLPRRKEGAHLAEVKTKLLKYQSDTNLVAFERSRAFDDAVISGLGWLEYGVRGDEEDDPILCGYEDWRCVWHDSLSRRNDLADSRYLFRMRYADLDLACRMWPDRAGEIKAAAIDESTYYDDTAGLQDDDVDPEREIIEQAEFSDQSRYSRRSRVRLIECWYREPEDVRVIRSAPDANIGTMDGMIIVPGEDGSMDVHAQLLVDLDLATTTDSLRMVMRHMVWCGDKYVLQDGPLPYRHQKFPLVPIWCFRKKRTGEPYGLVRDLRDPQDDYNKRRSKLLFMISSNRVIADDDATDDWDELHSEAQQPDGLIVKKSGAEVTINNEAARVGQYDVQLMAQDADLMQRSSGVTDENLGRETNAKSGIAIQRRQDQGHTVTATVFDNLRLAHQLGGQQQLSLTEQYYTGEKVIRIVGDMGQVDFEEINKPDPETGGVINDITSETMDFIVDAQQYSASIRQAMFESLGELLVRMDPAVALNLLDLWVDLSDLPGKDVMVERIRKINGQPDPDEDENSEEAQARQAAEQEKQEIQQRVMAAELAGKEADARLKQRNGELAEVEAQKVQAMIDDLEARMDTERAKLTIERAKLAKEIEWRAEELKIKREELDIKRESEKNRQKEAAERSKQAARVGKGATAKQNSDSGKQGGK